LFVAHCDEWFSVPDVFGLNWDLRTTPPINTSRPCYVIVRGFIDSVRLSADDWTQHADAILDHPLVVCPVVELTTHPGEMLVESPADYGCVIFDLLARRWPTVRDWKLPAEPSPMSFMDTVQRFTDDAIRSLGIPPHLIGDPLVPLPRGVIDAMAPPTAYEPRPTRLSRARAATGGNKPPGRVKGK
jgi:hypothetical protein